MNEPKESHVTPAIIAIIGVVAFLVLVYLLFSFGISLIDRLLNWSSAGTPVSAITHLLRTQRPT